MENAQDYNWFVQLVHPSLYDIFDHPDQGQSSEQKLLRLLQGNVSVADYAIKFRTMAEMDYILAGLQGCRYVTQLLHNYGHQAGPTSPRSRAPRPPAYISQTSEPPPSQAPCVNIREESPGEPMDISSSRLSAWERKQRIAAGRCIYFGEANHRLENCPRRRASALTPTRTHRSFCLAAALHFSNQCLSVSPYIESGSAGNLISPTVVSSLWVPVWKLPTPISVTALYVI